MILAVMRTIKEIAIEPEKKNVDGLGWRNRNFFNCVHRCEDHSSREFTYMIYHVYLLLFY